MRPSFWILSTGTELAQGRSRDTNSMEIARGLSDQGFDIAGISILPDNPEILLSHLNWMLSREDLVGFIMTGGLGPTDDDCTVDMLARWTGSAITEDAPAMRRLDAFARLRRRIDITTARRQIRVLADHAVIPNPTGLAPGIMGSKARADGAELWFCALPGVPSEMRPMYVEAFARLSERIHAAPVFRVDFHIYEEPESDFQKVVFGNDGLSPESLNSDPEFRWGVAAIPGSLKVFLEHETDAAILDRVHEAVKEHYGHRYLDRSVDDLLPELLLRNKVTVGLAESCTGGLIAKIITDRAGSSAYFAGSAVTYSNQSKTDILGVSDEILREHGAVSEECAIAMAEGARQLFRSDVGISVTGIAGPDGGSDEKPVGTVFAAIATGSESSAFRLFYPLDRERVREYTSRAVLFRLHLKLIEMTKSTSI